MPLGNVIGEFTARILSVKQTALGGGQVQLEIDSTGESTGPMPGQTFATLVVTLGGGLGRPAPCTVTGVLLAASGAVVRFSAQGMGIRTGEGHKVRLRAALCYATDDPNLAAINGMIAAVEAEVDPAMMTIKGAGCEWK
jgi:hypothetical protein